MMKFTGDGKLVVPGVPMRDLTDEEVKQFGEKFLLESRLYEKPKSKPKTKDNKGGE